MMSNFLKGILAQNGLTVEEDATATLPVVDEPLDADELVELAGQEVPDSVVADEVDEDELVELAGASDALENESEKVEETVVVLEQLMLDMQSAVDDFGGMRHTEAARVMNTVNVVLGRIGVAGIPALSSEAYGDVGSRRASTVLNLEDVGEVVKKLKAGLIEGLKKLREMAKQFWLKITDTAGRMSKRAAALEKQAKLLPSEEFFDIQKNLKLSEDPEKMYQWVGKYPTKFSQLILAGNAAIFGFAKTVSGELTSDTAAEIKKLQDKLGDSGEYPKQMSISAEGKLDASKSTFGQDLASRLEHLRTLGGLTKEFSVLVPKRSEFLKILDNIRVICAQVSDYNRTGYQAIDAAVAAAVGKLGDGEDAKAQAELIRKNAQLAISLPRQWGSYVCQYASVNLSFAATVISQWNKTSTKEGEVMPKEGDKK